MRIRELRKSLGLTQQDVANMLNIERTSYARYESGCREPDIATLIQLADLFQVSLDYLCSRTDAPFYTAPGADGSVAFSIKKEAPFPKEGDLPQTIAADVNVNDLPKDRKELEEFVLELLRKNH